MWHAVLALHSGWPVLQRPRLVSVCSVEAGAAAAGTIAGAAKGVDYVESLFA
jgi:hypothetical protein